MEAAALICHAVHVIKVVHGKCFLVRFSKYPEGKYFVLKPCSTHDLLMDTLMKQQLLLTPRETTKSNF
jgi:hypothetical protein